MKNYFILTALFTIILLSSCSSYTKVLKSDDYAAKFDMANEMYDGGSEVKSIALYEQVYQRLPKTPEGEVSYFRIGKAYYIGGDTYMAGYYLGMFSKRFSTSPKAEEAMFLSALCGVAESPTSSLDQDPTKLAIGDFQEFIDRFPNSNLVDSSNHIIDRLRFKIEKKEYESVKLYAKTEKYRAAVSASLTFMDDYPMSQFKEEVYFVLVENSYYLSKNSIESKKLERIDNTIERYRTFVSEFPESKYRNIASRYNDQTVKDKQIFIEESKL